MKKMLKKDPASRNESISKDGIGGARTSGVFLLSLLVPHAFGIYALPAVVCVAVIGTIILILVRKKIGEFFSINDWKKEYWLVCLGFVLLGSGIASFLFNLETPVISGLEMKHKVIVFLICCIIGLGSIPPHTWLAKFATQNFNMQEKMWK